MVKVVHMNQSENLKDQVVCRYIELVKTLAGWCADAKLTLMVVGSLL